MKVFIPEKYVRSREIVVEIPGEGFGILVSQERLRKLLAERQVDPVVLTHNLLKVVHEH